MTTSFVKFEVLDVLQGRGLEKAEVLLKSGRSRRLVVAPGTSDVQLVAERGWAVRAGDRHCSFFASGSGWPRPGGPWPEPDGYPLRLPEGRDVGAWREPRDLEAPIIGEIEASALLDAVGRELDGEKRGARLSLAVLEDGSSECELVSTLGVEVSWRQRLASIRLHATDPASGAVATLVAAKREARELHPSTLARSLAHRLEVISEGDAPARDRGDFVLGPAVGAALLAGLAPLLVGARAMGRLRALADGVGRIASSRVGIVDDGRLEDGLLATAVDGEGVPTGRQQLVEEGTLRQPLLPWWEVKDRDAVAGCSRRASWRDQPRPGPTHLFFEPRPEVPASRLVAGVSRGYYLLAATGPCRVDDALERFAMPVCGFAVTGGVAKAPVAGAHLCGSVGGLLNAVQEVARDLSFFPLDGMIGSPSMLVSGLELRTRH